MMKELGTLTVKVTFDTQKVSGVHLSIPLLGIEEHVTHNNRYERIEAGTYDAVITSYLATGGEIDRSVKIKIFPNQENVHVFNLSKLPQEVTIRPIDSRSHTILYAEIKIEGVDTNFRPVRDPQGLVSKLTPGDYLVKILLPDLQMKTVPLVITEDVHEYTLLFEDEEEKATKARRERRIPVCVPVAYRTNEGTWFSTRSINLSPTGICCLLKGQHKISDEGVFVRLFVPISKVPIECYAKVRWAREEGNTLSKMGLELRLPNTAKTSLSNWLAQKS